MNRELDTVPASDAELFDMLHSLFGIGDFDDSKDILWFRFRMNEIGKLKALRRKRRISLADMALTARYCRRIGEPIDAGWRLCGFIADAKREARRIAVPELTRDVAEAVALERSLPVPDESWIQRLLLARGPHRADVLDEYRQGARRQVPST